MFVSAFLLFWWTKSKLCHSDFLRLRAVKVKLCNNSRLVVVVDLWLLLQCLNCWSFVGAFYVAVSRIDGHRHFPTDVLAGILLGFMNALLCYQCFFGFRDPFSLRVNRMLKSGEILHKRKRDQHV